ncbi:MAG: sulfatase-like hydrolase/transferase [Planctomycetota bacterium]
MNMTRACLAVFLLFFSTPASADTEESAKPNVIVIVADDLGWAAVGFHSDWIETPGIDRIANEGVQLDRFYTAPMCSPTRAGLMTGRYPIRFGMARSVITPHRDYGLPTQERTLPEALGEAGYEIRGAFGKWHLGHHRPEWHPLQQGFTHFEGHYNGNINYFELSRDGQRDWHEGYVPSDKQGYATEVIGDAAADFVRKASAEDAPYFCYVPFNAPHSPFQALESDIADVAGEGEPTRRDIYVAMIRCMDRQISKILTAIDESGEADNTQVWFFSDNGGTGGFDGNNAPLRGAKGSTFEGGIRVAACVRWPDQFPAGTIFDAQCGYIDVLPTVLSTAGVNPLSGQIEGKELDGVDLSSLLRDEQVELPERDWLSYQGQSGPQRERTSIHSGDWKLIIEGADIRNGIGEDHKVHLFAIHSDPNETDDVSSRFPEVVEELSAKLIEYRSLQPEDGVQPASVGSEGFVPWEDWKMRGVDNR